MLTALKIYILQKKSSRISPFLIQMWQPTMLRILRVLCLSSRELVSQRFVEIWLKTFPWRNRKFPTSDLQQAARRRKRQELSNLLFWMIPTFFTQLKQAKWLCKTQKIMVCWLSLGMWNVFFWNVKCLTKKIKILSILISFSYVSKVWLTELAGFSY